MNEKCIQNFGEKPLESDHLGDHGDGRIILMSMQLVHYHFLRQVLVLAVFDIGFYYQRVIIRFFNKK
jgi:hypothetical protein